MFVKFEIKYFLILKQHVSPIAGEKYDCEVFKKGLLQKCQPNKHLIHVDKMLTTFAKSHFHRMTIMNYLCAIRG